MRAILPAILVLVLGLCSTCASAGVGSRHAAPGPPRFVLVVELPHVAGHLQQTRVEAVDARGRVVRFFATDGVSVSPDGKLVALDTISGLFVEPMMGRRLRLLSSGLFPYGVWSPDSKRMLLPVSDGSTLAIATVATGAKRLVPMPEEPRLTYTPVAWSSVTREIIVVAYREGLRNGFGCCRTRLLVADPTGASTRTIYDDDDPGHGTPHASLSPDGRWLAYTTENRGNDPGFAVIDVRTGRTTRIRGFLAATQQPVWSPDSSRFAVGGYRSPIEVFSNRGHRLRSIGERSARPVAWTRAGIYIVRASGSASRLLLIPAGRTAPKLLFALPRGEAVDWVQLVG